MPIYTKTGDDGTTGLFGGRRLLKSDIQVEAYGSLDELSSTLGVFISHIDNGDEAQFIEQIQRDIYVIMGFLADAPTKLSEQKNKIALFEKKIDLLTSHLPPLNNFIIPGGSNASCWAHMARVTARRAERVVIGYFKTTGTLEGENQQIIVMYLNRLSDLLFTYARSFNGEKDIISKKA